LFAAVIAVALVLILINPNFANPNLAVSVLRSMASVAIMALGLTLVIVAGEIDLSFGAMYGLAANSLAVLWIVLGVPVFLAIPIAILLGAGVGLFNGLLVTGLRIPSFIVTLGSYNVLYGLSLWVTNTGTFNPEYPPPGAEVPAGELAFFVGLTETFGAYRVSLQVLWMLAIAAAGGLPAAPVTLGVPPDGHRRQPCRGPPRAVARAAVQGGGLHAVQYARSGRRHPRLLVHSRLPSPTSA
jgi:ribose/xylose/arabinose/galactoside ABC-type transport system permease subunit